MMPGIFDIFHSRFTVLQPSHHAAVCYKQRAASRRAPAVVLFARRRGFIRVTRYETRYRGYTRAVIPSDPLDAYWRWRCLRRHRSPFNDREDFVNPCSDPFLSRCRNLICLLDRSHGSYSSKGFRRSRIDFLFKTKSPFDVESFTRVNFVRYHWI